MRTLLKGTMSVTTLLAIVGALTIGAREAAAGGSTRRDLCQGCSSTPQCRDCCIQMGHDDGQCQVSGACLCINN